MTWARKDLERSEHISKILIHPEDANTLWVAAQGAAHFVAPNPPFGAVLTKRLVLRFGFIFGG